MSSIPTLITNWRRLADNYESSAMNSTGIKHADSAARCEVLRACAQELAALDASATTARPFREHQFALFARDNAIHQECIHCGILHGVRHSIGCDTDQPDKAWLDKCRRDAMAALPSPPATPAPCQCCMCRGIQCILPHPGHNHENDQPWTPGDNSAQLPPAPRPAETPTPCQCHACAPDYAGLSADYEKATELHDELAANGWIMTDAIALSNGSRCLTTTEGWGQCRLYAFHTGAHVYGGDECPFPASVLLPAACKPAGPRDAAPTQGTCFNDTHMHVDVVGKCLDCGSPTYECARCHKRHGGSCDEPDYGF